MSGADVMQRHRGHELEDRPDGTVRCHTCAHTLLPTHAPKALYSGIRPGCAVCVDGFKGENERGDLIACLTCRPHLIPLFNRREAREQQRARLLAEREARP